jgi:hypothetical protein
MRYEIGPWNALLGGKNLVEVEMTFGVPDEIVAELKKKYADEKENNLRVTKANPLNPPYYAWGDPRAKFDVMKFGGKEYWVYKVTKGKNMNWVFSH